LLNGKNTFLIALETKVKRQPEPRIDLLAGDWRVVDVNPQHLLVAFDLWLTHQR